MYRHIQGCTRSGIDGNASGLWSEFARIIGEARPRFVIVDELVELLHRGIDRVLGDLASIGYDAEWHCVPAAYAGAPIDGEGRDRCWIVAYPHDDRLEGPLLSRELAWELVGSTPWRHFDGRGLRRSASYWIEDEPRIPRVADGVPNRAHRIAAIGNAVCPPVVAAIGRAIMATDTSGASLTDEARDVL